MRPDTDRDPGATALGAVPVRTGGFQFRVWAPRAREVSVVYAERRRRCTLSRGDNGYFEGMDQEAVAGNSYWLRVDHRRLSDPVSRYQPEGVEGPSALVDLADGREPAGRRDPIDLARAVLYELHVGTFTPEGTFDAARARLPELAGSGVTVVELLPVEEERGERGWGYGPVHQFAVSRRYGGPAGLHRFVAAAHAVGLNVFLDVVYNHWSLQARFLERFGPYFHPRAVSPWGPTPNVDGPGSDEVRRYFLENARMWLEEYQVDGFRLDAVHEVHDRSSHHFWGEVSERCRAVGDRTGRRPVLIAESALNDVRIMRPVPEGGWGLDAQWCDDFHHSLHAALTGERGGYYVDYGSLAALARAFERPFLFEGGYSRYLQRRHGAPAAGVGSQHFVVFDQNHDQIGNRGDGARLTTLLPTGLARVALGLTVLSPYVPMLFMGEEYGEKRPFYFFADPPKVLGPRLAAGRRRELAANGFPEPPPDPSEPATFERSKLDWAAADSSEGRTYRAFVAELLRLRRGVPAFQPGGTVSARAEEEARQLVIHRQHGNHAAVLLVNLGPSARPLTGVDWPGDWAERFRSDQPLLPAGEGGASPRWSLRGGTTSLPVPGQSLVVLELVPGL